MFGRTLVIVNPAARSGKAAEVAAHATLVFDRIQKRQSQQKKLTFRYTVGPKDATQIAKCEGSNYDTLVALGGDGMINEVVNGLMDLPINQRPALALIPCGNGDDFARTIKMSRKPNESLKQFESLALTPTSIDVGRANDIWFLETLSFGLDAAIALGTADLRKKTKRTGTSLYLQCGIDQLVNHREIRHATLTLDDNKPQQLGFYLLAIQNGVSYGGGFKICPKANLTDGLFDICYATPTLSASEAIKLLLKAKNGKHTEHPNLTFAKARRAHLSLPSGVPTQIDGEELLATEYEIVLHPKQLTVLIPNS